MDTVVTPYGPGYSRLRGALVEQFRHLYWSYEYASKSSNQHLVDEIKKMMWRFMERNNIAGFKLINQDGNEFDFPTKMPPARPVLEGP
jgi:hypothetical protein